MDKKFLNKVVDQIVSETNIDYDQEILYTPFSLPFASSPISNIFIHIPIVSFFTHCEEVYGLTYDELEYVWKKYKSIIGNEIESKDNLNEARISSKINSDFLDEVVQYLIDNTVIIPDKTISVSHEKSKRGKIIIPVKSGIELEYYYNTLLNPSIVLLFSDEMENVYGLDPGLEIKYVWDKYKKHIFSNI